LEINDRHKCFNEPKSQIDDIFRRPFSESRRQSDGKMTQGYLIIIIDYFLLSILMLSKTLSEQHKFNNYYYTSSSNGKSAIVKNREIKTFSYVLFLKTTQLKTES